jgi:hypothetical protein
VHPALERLAQAALIAQGCSSSTGSSAPHRRETAKLAKQRTAIAGTHRALLANMHDADAIEAINFEQLATVTDRLLLRRGQVSRRPPTEPSLAPLVPLRPLRPLGPLARGSHVYLEGVRPAPAPHAQVFAITVVIPMLVGIAIGLATLL